MIRCIFISSALFIAASAWAADEVPRLAVEKSCRTAQQLESLPQPLFDACMRDERDAESRLNSGAWQNAKASSRSTCVANQEGSGAQSYVELLTCIQLMDGTIIKPENPK